MSRKKIIDFPEIGNMSTLAYYELLLSGKRATRHSTKVVQSPTTNPLQKTSSLKQYKKKQKKEGSSPQKKKKIDELVPPSPPEEKIKLKYLYGCVWGQDVIDRKVYLDLPEGLLPGVIKSFESVKGEELLPVKYQIDEKWYDLRNTKLYLSGEIVEYQGKESEILWNFPFPISYPTLLLKTPDNKLQSANDSDLRSAKFPSDLKQWIRQRKQVEVLDSEIKKFYYRFVAAKNSSTKILILRKHEATGKYFVYKEKQFRWINPEKFTLYCNMAEPPIPLNILARYNVGQDLRRLYKNYFQNCELSFPNSNEEIKDFCKQVRCKVCDYILDVLEYKQCENCQNCFHSQCLEPVACKNGIRGVWRCPDCPRCENCLGVSDKLLRCLDCNNCFHERCVDQNALPTPGKIWRCDLCAQCVHCKIRATDSNVKWNETITKCTSCDAKWKKNEYCSICEKFWFSKKGRQSRTEQRLSQNDDPEMIECDKCKMWVHLICDTSMTPDLWSIFTADKNKKYYCPKCFKETKNTEMINIIHSLMELEKNGYFITKIEDQYYKKVIKSPMFFETMIENAKEGIYHNQIQLLREHFTLLCENAMNFLKANTDGYKAAKKLLEDGIFLLDHKFLPIKRKKSNSNVGVKKPKTDCDLEGFSMDLPTELDKPEYYEFSIDLLSSLPRENYSQPLNIIINKSDIQPYMVPKPLLSFYPGLFPISYSDPVLCILEQCYICASFIQSLDFLLCQTCGRAFHTFCVSAQPNNILAWQCKDCKLCEICHSTQDALNLLYCKKCEKGFDIPCLWPNIKSGLYLKDWICDNCFECSRCHAKSYHIPSFSPTREDFFSDFSLCYKCKWVVINKEYCQECGKDWRSPYDPDPITYTKTVCKSCEYFFHPDCISDSKGICHKCNTNSSFYTEIEQGAVEKTQNLMSIVTQTSIYQILAKHCIQDRYKLDNDIANVLGNFFLLDNQEFMVNNKDIKEFFVSRGVEIVKKSTKKKSVYKNSRVDKIEGLRVSDIPSITSPLVRMHRPKDPLHLWNVEWDTSALILSLSKILTPLDPIELVEIPFQVSEKSAVISFIPEFILDFDHISEYMELKKDSEHSIVSRYEWLRVNIKEISPIVDETLYEEKSDCFKLFDPSQDVLVKEYTHEQVIEKYVNSELPAAIAFINQFEAWLGKRMLDITQHLLNSQKIFQASENLPVLKILNNNENVENDLTGSLSCILCKETGEKIISGRLLPCEENSWVHVNCAFWSSECKVDDNGHLHNFHLSVSRGKKTKCKVCNKFGATLNCSAKKCHNSYHFPCALAGPAVFLNHRTNLCTTCIQSKESITPIPVTTLIKPLTEKIIIFKSKKHLKKPNFSIGNFNRIGSLIITDISDKFCSYRLVFTNSKRTIFKCQKQENFFIISECSLPSPYTISKYEDKAKEVTGLLENSKELMRSTDIEELWPKVKMGESFAIKTASDFFGLSATNNFSITLGSGTIAGTAKESKSILEKIANIKPSPYGSSKLQPFTKHKVQHKPKKSQKNTKSVGYEEHQEGKSETILVSEYRKYKKTIDRESFLEVASSHIHGLGLFTTKDISAGKIVVEYIGEIVRNRIADMREKEYELKGIGQGSCYLFRLDEDHVIDATVKGGKARFINHSCQPSCAASVCEIDGEKHILLFAKRFIHKNEEITYDYNFEVEEDKISCQCGSKDCQGKLN